MEHNSPSFSRRALVKAGAGLAFGRLKGLTIYGYFTSKVVDQDILKTQMFFNGYQGNVPFTPAV